jgi:hypothetical protein
MRILLTLIFALSSLNSFAFVCFIGDRATSDTLINSGTSGNVFKKEIFRKNIIKVNLSSFALYNNSLSYERSLSRKITIVAGYRYMPKVRVSTPFLMKQVVKKYAEEDQELMDGLNSIIIGNNTLTSELRFYTGRKPGARGFYLSLYGRYMNLTAAYPHEYRTEKGTYRLPFDGTIKGFAGGLMIGSQWLIAKRITLDWYIIGAQYGKLKIDMPAAIDLKTMSADDRRGLKEDVESVISSLKPLVDAAATVSDQGVDIKGSLPLPGIRGLGFNLGVAF